MDCESELDVLVKGMMEKKGVISLLINEENLLSLNPEIKKEANKKFLFEQMEQLNLVSGIRELLNDENCTSILMDIMQNNIHFKEIMRKEKEKRTNHIIDILVNLYLPLDNILLINKYDYSLEDDMKDIGNIETCIDFMKSIF